MGDYSNNSRKRPDNYLVWSILSTVLCCVPTGIVAIVHAAKVDRLWSEGDYDEAEDAARKAKTWALVGAGLGLLVIVIYGILVAVGAASEFWE